MNIYKYTFYLFYKFGIKIKTPDPAFAAVCIVSIVILSQLMIILSFLEVKGVFISLYSSPYKKPIVVMMIFVILYICYRYIFGLKELKYLRFVELYDEESLTAKLVKSAVTIFVILVVPILCGVALWQYLWG